MIQCPTIGIDTTYKLLSLFYDRLLVYKAKVIRED